MKRVFPREHGLWAWVGVPLVAAVVMAPTLATAGAASVVLVGFGVVNTLRVRWPRTPWFEVPGILSLAAVGAGVGIAGGAETSRMVAVQLALGTWQVLGLWWVRDRLAAVLPGRTPWARGGLVGAGLVLASAGAGAAIGEPFVGAVPYLYGVRMLCGRAPTRAVEARRVGLEELAWALGATALALSA